MWSGSFRLAVAFLVIVETRLVTVRKLLHRSCWTDTCQGKCAKSKWNLSSRHSSSQRPYSRRGLSTPCLRTQGKLQDECCVHDGLH